MKNVTANVRIEFTHLFTQQRKQAPLAIKIALRETLEMFRDDPLHASLRNHALDRLGKTCFGLWSIDVRRDWCAIYRREGEWIIFIALGTHEQLYGVK